MSKLSFVLIVVCLGVSWTFNFAESVDDGPQAQALQDQANVDDQDEDSERAGGRANAQASANAQGRARPLGAPVPVYRSCYSCADCPVILSNTTSKYCPPSVNPDRHKKCVVYKEKYSHMAEPWTIRGCASIRGSCAEIVENHKQIGSQVKLVSCKECVGDLCNTSGAGQSAPNFIIACLALLLTPLMAKNLLS